MRAPIDATLVETVAQPGAFVEAGAPLFRLVDLARVVLDVHVPEHDAERVVEPHGLWIERSSGLAAIELPPSAAIGRAAVIDAARTMTVRYALPSSALPIAVGTRLSAHLYTGPSVELPSIPLSAVVDDAGTPVVFVQVEGESFERRVVRLAHRERDLVGVSSGVREGEHVVTRGAFAVKLAASSGTIPAHGHSH